MLLFLLGLILLYFSGDFLIDYSVKLAKKFKVSELFIGLTVVAFGTSFAELVVSSYAVLNNLDTVAMGNIIGSNVSNILLILGVGALFSSIKLNFKKLKYDIFLMLFSSLIFSFIAFTFKVLKFYHGIFFISILLYYIYFSYKLSKNEECFEDKETENEDIKENVFFIFFIILLSLFFICLGGKLFTDGAIQIARYFKVSEAFISLTIVSIGTSLPELVAMIISSLKKKSELAIGNIIGSNIFNILFIGGFCSLLRDIEIDKSLNSSTIIMNILTVFLFFLTYKNFKLEKKFGFCFLILYFSYLFFI